MTITAAPAATRIPVVIYVAIAGSWIAAIAAEVSGQSRWLHHGAVGGGGLPLPLAIVLFLLAWQLMIVAMMVPSTLPMFRLFRTTSAAGDRPVAAQAAFLGGYASVWTAFGLAALAVDAEIRHLMDAVAWTDARPWVLPGVLLVLAGAAQFLPLTQACLTQCRHPFYYLLQHYRPGVGGGYRLGVSHGLFCVGCCWALMLVMFAAGMSSFIWMAVLATIMTYQKIGAHGARLTAAVGVALMCLGTSILLQPDLFPDSFTGDSGHHSH